MHGEILATWRDPVTDTLVTKSVQERHVRWDADRARRFREDRHMSSLVSFMDATNACCYVSERRETPTTML